MADDDRGGKVAERTDGDHHLVGPLIVWARFHRTMFAGVLGRLRRLRN